MNMGNKKTMCGCPLIPWPFEFAKPILVLRASKLNLSTKATRLQSQVSSHAPIGAAITLKPS